VLNSLFLIQKCKFILCCELYFEFQILVLQ